MSDTQLKIAVIGSNGSGKTTVCNYLENNGFKSLSLSNIVREEASAKGREHTRENLIQTANEIKEEKGLDYLAIKSIEKSTLYDEKNIVFDSIRNPNEVHYLQDHNVHCIKISVPVELRYKRIVERQHDTDHISFDTFKAQCEREENGSSSGQHLSAAMELCPYSIENSGDQDDLYRQVEHVITQIKAQH